MSRKSKKPKIRVLELVPSKDHASKPFELIQIRGHENLTLAARRAITILWHNAHRQGIEEGKRYHIRIDELVTERHKGSQQVGEALELLMQTLVVIPISKKVTHRIALLGSNIMDETTPAGVLSYRFDSDLIGVLQNSNIWGKISIPALMSLSSKYSISLYENVSQWVGLSKTTQDFSLEDFRELLGVAPGKYEVFGEFNREILKRALSEINVLAPFNLSVEPLKTGRKVTGIRLSWWPKSGEELEAAEAEISRSKVGRRARIAQQIEMILEGGVDSPVDDLGDNPVDDREASPKTS